MREVAGRSFPPSSTRSPTRATCSSPSGRLNGDDQWFGLHGMAELPEGRGGNDDVTSVVALAADLDWDHEAHHTDRAAERERGPARVSASSASWPRR